MNKIKLVRILFLCLLIILSIWTYGLIKFVESIPLNPNNINLNTEAIIIIKSNTPKFDKGLKILQEGKSENMLVTGLDEGYTIGMISSESKVTSRETYKVINKIDLQHCCKNESQTLMKAINWIKQKNYKSISLIAANNELESTAILIKKKLPFIEIDKHPVTPDRFEINNWWKMGRMKKLVFRSYNNYLFAKFRFW